MTDVPQYLSNVGSVATNARGFLYSRLYRFNRGAAAGHATSGIVPQAVAWPHTADLNGDSFPAGLVGVRMAYVHQQLDPVAYNDARLIAVPAVLPAAYTPRWNRDHNQGTRGLSTAGSISTDFGLSTNAFMPGARSTPGQWLLRADDGLYDVPRYNSGGVTSTWAPYNAGQNCLVCNNPSGVSDLTWSGTTGETLVSGYAGVPGFDGTWFTSPCAGVRYLRFACHFNSAGELRIRFICNANGSKTFPADTVLAEWVFSVAGPGVYYSSTVGPFNATLGSPKFYGFSAEDRLLPADPWRGVTAGIRIQAGPRLDIPLPFTATGEGSLIAPGGVVPGSLPGY